MDKKTINKAACNQAALQIAAGIRRLHKAWKFLDNQCFGLDGNKDCREACFRVSKAIDEANKALSEVRRLVNG